MANLQELEKVIEDLKAKNEDGFSKLDYVFEEIVTKNPNDLAKSIELIEGFLIEELVAQRALEKAA